MLIVTKWEGADPLDICNKAQRACESETRLQQMLADDYHRMETREMVLSAISKDEKQSFSDMKAARMEGVIRRTTCWKFRDVLEHKTDEIRITGKDKKHEY